MSQDHSAAIVVLVAEDESIVRQLAAEMLEDEGYGVFQARDGQEALTILELRGEDVRVLLSDIAMPNLGGLKLAAIVQDRWPHIGIVLGSADPGPNIRQEAPPGARFLSKPFRSADVLEAVRIVLLDKAAPGPAVALHSIPTLHAGQMHGAGGLAQPLPEAEE
jgi:CheY-like chemotaxis protein